VVELNHPAFLGGYNPIYTSLINYHPYTFMDTLVTRGLCAFIAAATTLITSCGEVKTINEAAVTPLVNDAALVPDTAETVQNTAVFAAAERTTETDSKTVLSRPQVPILCYHQIRDWRPFDSKQAKDYIVPVARFEEHIKMLADSGYHTILPDQLLAYLTTGAPLPEKPVLLTFDDTNLD
jgi:hypothetical protein